MRVHADWARPASSAVLALDDAPAADSRSSSGALKTAGAQLVDLFNARDHRAPVSNKEFDVISRMSTRAFCGRRARLSDIGAWLGTDYVFWGNCGITRDRLSVRFELAKYRFAIGDLGRQLWTGKAWAEALRMSGVPD